MTRLSRLYCALQRHTLTHQNIISDHWDQRDCMNCNWKTARWETAWKLSMASPCISPAMQGHPVVHCESSTKASSSKIRLKQIHNNTVYTKYKNINNKKMQTCIFNREKLYETKISEYLRRDITKCTMILTGRPTIHRSSCSGWPTYRKTAI